MELTFTIEWITLKFVQSQIKTSDSLPNESMAMSFHGKVKQNHETSKIMKSCKIGKLGNLIIK
jgi:hypothetical protein